MTDAKMSRPLRVRRSAPLPSYGLVSCAVLLALTPPATAQTPPGASYRSGALASRTVATRVVARCLVRSNRSIAIRYVQLGDAPKASETAEQRRTRETLTASLTNCLQPDYLSLQLNGLELRGSLAEALLKTDDSALLTRVRASPALPAQRLTGDTAREPLFGCIVGAMPAETAAMLDAEPESPAEAAAFRSFMPALQACVPVGAEVHIKPANVRLWVAIALFDAARARS